MTLNDQPVPLSRIFGSFARVGAVMFGGGYAMLPLLEREVVERRGWRTHAEMGEIYALAQVIPGVIAVNTAILAGHRMRGAAGAVAAALGMVSAPIAVILALAAAFPAVSGWALVARLFAGLRPAVAGLLLATACRMVGRGAGWERALAAVACACALAGFAGPTALILAAAALGLLGHLWAAARSRRAPR